MTLNGPDLRRHFRKQDNFSSNAENKLYSVQGFSVYTHPFYTYILRSSNKLKQQSPRNKTVGADLVNLAGKKRIIQHTHTSCPYKRIPRKPATQLTTAQAHQWCSNKLCIYIYAHKLYIKCITTLLPAPNCCISRRLRIIFSRPLKLPYVPQASVRRPR